MNELTKRVLISWRDCSVKRVEQINKWLGMPTEDLEIPVECLSEPVVEIPIEEASVEQESSTIVEPTKTAVETASSKEFESLCVQLADMVNTYDMIAKQMPDGEAKDILADMSEQIISSMNLGGCKAITKEPSYNPLRHKPVPFTIADEGTPITSTIRAGVELNGKVLIQAQVKL